MLMSFLIVRVRGPGFNTAGRMNTLLIIAAG